MRAVLSAGFLCLVTASFLWGAMTDTEAYLAVQKLYGNNAMMSKMRWPGSGNWFYGIGVKADGCQSSKIGKTPIGFLLTGSALNSWDAAFKDAADDPPTMSGPYRGVINMRASSEALDNVAAMQFWIDSAAYMTEIVQTPGQHWDVVQAVDTRALSNGVHVICVQARDVAGNVGRGLPHLFRVDQVLGSTAEWQIPQSLPPSISTEAE